MTDSQFLVLLGTVWIAPHSHPILGNFVGAFCITLAAIKGLGWI
jgi:hypothetical protein